MCTHFHHQIEYLASTLARNDTDGDQVVVLTIRLPDTFQPANVGIKTNQAERLLHDLKRLLGVTSIILMLFLTGCSTKVDVSTDHSNGDESSAVRTTVEVDFLSEEEADFEPPLGQEESVSSGSGDADIANFAIVVVENNVEIHHRHKHLHFGVPQEPKRKIKNPERDPECERLRREYEVRMKEWRELFLD
jgi:hypothetical protein